jgi:hypothetical protein
LSIQRGQHSETRERQTEHAGFPEAGGEPSGFGTIRRDLPGQEHVKEIGRTSADNAKSP